MKPETAKYEIRRDGETICQSSIARCGYSQDVIRRMTADGYRYYVDGKLQRKAENA